MTILLSALLILTAILVSCAEDAASVDGDYNENYALYADDPQTVQDFANIFIENLAQTLSVGIFDNVDQQAYIRPANIIATQINALEKEAEFDHIMPYVLELWRLDFMLQTDDLESETLRWGTFSPDSDGWIGHHTAWNEARTVLVFSRDDNELTFLGHIDWWMEETPSGMEGALLEFLERQ